MGDGILINDFCRTGHPDIYAAGDVAEGKDFVSGARSVQGNWMTAVEQGENAALNMLGMSCAYLGSAANTNAIATTIQRMGVSMTSERQRGDDLLFLPSPERRTLDFITV